MRRAVVFIVVALAGCGAPESKQAHDADVADRVRRLAAMLDYVSADYPGCVDNGQIVSDAEFAEQQIFMKDAAALLKSLPPPKLNLELFSRVQNLARDVNIIAPADQVSGAARKLGKDVLRAYDVVIAPSSPPSLERGALLFKENCVRCHGDGGAGDGPRTRELPPLKVPPRSFLDPAVMATMSPVRAWNALTDGIPEAEMPKWDLLPVRDRWSLAFYVMTLRHPRAPAEVAATSPTLGMLASSTDAELDGLGGLAYLRVVAPYVRTGALDTTVALLGESLEAYRANNKVLAREKAAAAYLDGFEPHEASLDRGAVVEIERGFLALREGMARAEPVPAIEQRVLDLQGSLERALPDEAPGQAAAFFTTLAIVFREGLEAALLILLLLAAVQKAGGGAAQRRAVHAGWLGAIAVGVLTWFVADVIFAALGGAQREWIEGVVSLLAAVVLLLVSHFVLVKADARRRVAAIRARLEDSLRSGRSAVWLASVGFIAVFREAFETVLFLQALVLDAKTNGAVVALGVAAATLLLVGIVYLMIRLGRRINPGRVLGVLSSLMCVLSIVMAGKGVRSLQEAGAIGQTVIGTLRIDWLGVFPTLETIAAQALMAIAFAVLALKRN